MHFLDATRAQDSQGSDDDCGDGDGGEDADGASIMVHGDASEVLEPAKEAFDDNALSTETWIEAAIVPLALGYLRKHRDLAGMAGKGV